MRYEDNPRRIYGRVDIVYSDSEISSDMTVETSGNAEISHPDEVFAGYLSPTVKACTMDGNAVMDGTFQMYDDNGIMGWWSDAACDSEGNFRESPSIELSFIQRPIITWIILGDVKLGQFPVDFTLQYKSNGEVKQTETITGNEKSEFKAEPKIEDITSIRLTVNKWNVPGACAKIMQFYDRLFERYEGDAVQMFEINEEMSSAEGNYNISSNTMTVSLYNKDRKFDRGYLRSLMLLGRKITPNLGIERDGTIHFEELGTYYSDEWQVSEDSQWVKCSAGDKLLRLQAKTYIGFPLVTNVSLHELATDIFTKLGYKSEEYIIDESLRETVIPNAYLPKTSAWDALQEIANAGLCRVYIDRLDRIVVKEDGKERERKQIEINGNNTFSSKSNITLTEFANEIEVEYNEVTLSDDVVEAGVTELTLGAGESMKLVLDYTTEISGAFMNSDNANIRITEFRSGINACEFAVNNVGSGFETAKLSVTGNAIVVNARKVTVRDEDSIKNYGVTEYSHPGTELIQSPEHAQYIASFLLKKMHAGEGVITTVWRGSPALQLGDEYSYIDRYGDEKQLICEYNKLAYDGGLKQETRGRKVAEGGKIM